MLTRDSLVNDIRQLGLIAGDLVMLHASLRAIGKILGGPDELHQAIMSILDPHGTLMMYVGCEPEFEIIARHTRLTTGEEFILKNCPAFNPSLARARHEYGTFAEFFRSWPGIVCSENPGARMAALGKRAIALTADHPLNFGYGPGSPLEKLYTNNGKLLLLGSDLDQITVLHFAEHIAPVEPKRIKHFRVPLLRNNRRVWVDIEEYDTSIGIRKWPDRFFEYIMNQFLQVNNVRPTKVGNAESYLIDVKTLVDFAISILVSEAKKYPV